MYIYAYTIYAYLYICISVHIHLFDLYVYFYRAARIVEEAKNAEISKKKVEKGQFSSLKVEKKN